MNTTVLKSLLSEWTDIEEAMAYIGVSLGVFSEVGDGFSEKWFFGSSNPGSNMLYAILTELEKHGVLESREGDHDGADSQYRWSPSYDVMRGKWDAT